MNVIIRADASTEIGSGHVMRCLTVARKLQDAGWHVRFWMEPLDGNLIEYVEEQGFSNITQPEQADLYIVDHYSLGIEWERVIRPFTKKLAVIDDLAREHDCDLLLDQNIVPNYEARYDGKVPAHCVKLLGPKYLIMRDEFIEARQQIVKRNDRVKRLLVFMGGTDPTNETMKVLKALANFSFEHVDVVVGNGNTMKYEIETVCHEHGYEYHCQIDYLAKLMIKADFAIGAGGSTMWERCYVELPSSATIVADNQRITTEFAAKQGVIINLGWHAEVTEGCYMKLLWELETGFLLKAMSKKCKMFIKTEKLNSWLDYLI